jgi:hypothetical protein
MKVGCFLTISSKLLLLRLTFGYCSISLFVQFHPDSTKNDEIENKVPIFMKFFLVIIMHSFDEQNLYYKCNIDL